MRDKSDCNYTLRKASPRDAPEISDLFCEAYGDSSHPCQEVAYVGQSLVTNHDLWLVAVADGMIVACTAGVWHQWNRIYETSRSVTRPAYQRCGLGRRLYQACLAHLYQRAECEIILGVPRSYSMYRLISEGLPSAQVLTGHDGGMNVARGLREYHLIGFTTNPSRPPQRIAPAARHANDYIFVKTEILSRLAFNTTEGPYPDALVVGPWSKQRVAMGPWTVGFDYDPDSLGRSLHITELSGPLDDVDGAVNALATFLGSVRQAEHICAYVLRDKLPLVCGLRELGFRITAYLPAWHYQDNRRYDCWMVAKLTSSVPPVAHRTDDLIAAFDSRFNRLTM